MLKDLFEYFAGTVKAGQRANVQEYDRFKDRIVSMPGGEVTTIEAEAKPRSHTVNSIEALVATIDDGFDDKNQNLPCVWFDRTGAIVVLDNGGYRLNTASLPLKLSPQFQAIQQLAASRKQISQKEAISMLRIDFAGCGVDSLVPILRQVKFQVNDAGQSELQRTKVSVGRSTLAEFHGLEALPEQVSFNVPVWEGKFLDRQSITVIIDPDPQSQTFRFVPLTHEVEAALAAAEANFGEAIRKAVPEGVPVLFGRP